MRNVKLLVAGLIGLAAAGGGIAAASAGSASPGHASAAAPTAQPSAPAQTAQPAGAASTIHVANLSVNGKTENILVNSQGLPLYTFPGDTATRSAVTGGLAALWPPLIATAPTESGATGQIKAVLTTNGSQVQYNGHFLYTFVSDSPGHVTGQGVQNFFVATPSGTSGATPAAPQPKSTPAYRYGY